MARRKDPESVVVDFFRDVPLETAQIVLNICKGIVASRTPKTAKNAKPVKTSTDTGKAGM